MSLYCTVSLFVFIGTLCLLFGIDFMREGRSILGAGFTHQRNLLTIARQLSPILARYVPNERMDMYDSKLLWAGSPLGITAEVLIGVKVLLAVCGASLGFLTTMLGATPLTVLLLALACFVFPDMLLRERVAQRQWRITNDMPLMLGLLVTALRSGVEFGQAFNSVAQSFPGALGCEMRNAWEQMATGTPRREALKIMALRTGVMNIRRFSDAVAASSERGNDQFSRQLDLLAKDAMDALYKAAQEDARKKPAMILIPLFLFILTPTLIMLLTPILMQISNMM